MRTSHSPSPSRPHRASSRSRERQPLLNKENDETEPPSVRAELALLAVSSLPVSISYALQNSLQTLSVVVIGRLGPRELSAAAFSYMWAMCTAWCVALGGTTALDTLASSLYTASPDHALVGVVLQRCFIVLNATYLPIAVLWWFTKPILLALGQSEQLATDVQAFLRVLSFGAPGYIAFESVKKFLQVQGIMHASTIVLLILAPVNVGLNVFFVHHTALGLLGGALATSISYWLSFLLLIVYVRFSRGKECWGGFDRRALSGLWTFAKLAIPGILMVCTEWVAFEIVAIVAGRLGPLPLSAQSVIMTVDQILNTLPFGIGVAASTRVGGLLGSRLPRHAFVAAHTAVLLATLVGLVVLTILLASRNVFGYIFTDDDATARLVAKVLPFVAAFQVADGWAMSNNGNLRGMARQHVGAAVNLLAYYAIALPLGIALAFKTSQGLVGLWIGQCVALFIVGIFEWFLVYRSDWSAEVDKAAKRMEADAGPTGASESDLLQ